MASNLNLEAGTGTVDPKRTAPERERVARRRGIVPKEGNKRLVADVPTDLHDMFRRQASAERLTITGLLVRVMSEYLQQRAKAGALYTFQLDLINDTSREHPEEAAPAFAAGEPR